MKQQMVTFLKRNSASKYVRIWVKKNCSSLQDAWDRASPERLIWLATCEGVLDDMTLRRFACFCARQVWYLLTDERLRKTVEVVERYCAGKAPYEELRTAAELVWDTAGSAREPVEAAKAEGAANRVARSAVWALIWVAKAEPAVEWAAAVSTAAVVARAEAGSTIEWAEAEQADWLRANAKPNFGEVGR